MDFTQLQFFRVLARTQHMTQAAISLNLAQSALSRSLKNLEDELGVKLFDRIGKYIYLNENGTVFLRHVEVILSEYEDSKRELEDRAGAKKKTVRLSMYAGSKLLPELLRDFQSLYPDISLRIMQQGSALESVISSDITVYSADKAIDEPDSVILMEEGICLAIPANHPLAGRDCIHLSEVSRELFICLYQGKGLRTITDGFCQQAGFIPNVILESDSPGTVRELISLGMGLAFIPKISWKGMGNDPSVKLVEIKSPYCSRFVIMKWQPNRYMTVAAVKLRDFLVDFFNRKKSEE